MTLKIITFLLPIISNQLGVIISMCSFPKPTPPNAENESTVGATMGIHETGFKILLLDKQLHRQDRKSRGHANFVL